MCWECRLFCAVSGGRYEEVMSLLPHTDGLSSLPDYIYSYKLLMESLNQGHDRITRLLLDRGCKVRDPLENRKPTPLHLAIKRKCNKDIIEMIIMKGGNIFALDDKGNRPFQIAIKLGDTEIVELFLKRGVQVNYASKYNRTKGRTLLHEAVYVQEKGVVELFLKYGANVDATCKYGDKVGHTPLHFAVLSNNSDIIELLLDYGANIEAKTNEGFTPLQLACLSGKVEAAAILMERGATIDAYGRFGSLLHLAFRSVAIIKMLLEAGIDPNITDDTGMTALHIAAMHADEEVAYTLIKSGVGINLKNIEGRTALHISCFNCKILCTFLLLEAGADVNIPDVRGLTPLHLVCQNGDFLALVKLLHFGADVNVLAGSYIPRYYATEEDMRSIGNILIKHIISYIALGFKMVKDNFFTPRFEQVSSRFKNFKTDCIKEIKLLQETKICSHSYVSYIDFLTRPLSEMYKFLKNEDIHEALTDIDTFVERYPIYGWLLKKNYDAASLRKKLVDAGVAVFNKYFPLPRLPLSCVEDILSHLSNEDLRIFNGMPSIVEELLPFSHYETSFATNIFQLAMMKAFRP